MYLFKAVLNHLETNGKLTKFEQNTSDYDSIRCNKE
jgi:hypothetical protein